MGKGSWDGQVESLVPHLKETDSTNLSIAYSNLSNLRSGAAKVTGSRKSVLIAQWVVMGEREYTKLRSVYANLEYGALDVLASWEIQTAKRFWWRRSRALMTASRARFAAESAYDTGRARAHEVALAFITYARALMLQNFKKNDGVRAQIRNALSFESEIRKETDRPQALRQLTRVLKNAAALRQQLGEYEEAAELYRRASELAVGEAATLSQAAQLDRR